MDEPEVVQDAPYLRALYLNSMYGKSRTLHPGIVIHLNYPVREDCRVAIVTGIDYEPHVMYCAVFRKRGDMDRCVVNLDAEEASAAWHLVDQCPLDISREAHTG